MLDFPFSGIRICHGMAHHVNYTFRTRSPLGLYRNEIEGAGRI